MFHLSALVSGILISGAWCVDIKRVFPPGFKFGAATASYQVEGAWNVSDKGESMWDRLLHSHPEIVLDGSNGDVTCDSYHLWRRDIEMAVELGLQVYRFSISWSRLLPTGYPNIISEDGKNYYNNLIDGLLEKGIEPLVTLYHFELPQNLLDLGGWANPLIADWFADYARVVYTLFADRVKTFLTINEPIIVCDAGYNKMSAPYLNDSKVAVYLCNKNLLIAHAKAYRVYDEDFRSQFKGKLSIANLFLWFEPETPEDEEAKKLVLQFWEGRYAHPIFAKQGGWPPELETFLAANSKLEGYHQPRLPPFTDEETALVRGRYAHPIFAKQGGWPPELETFLAANSKLEGYHQPRLPPFTDEETALVRGTADFYALNHYTTRVVRKVNPGEEGPWLLHGSDEIGVSFVTNPSWEIFGPDWFALYPEGLRTQLHWLNKTYGVKEIMITENGVPCKPDLTDFTRLTNMRNYLEQILLAISDGINVTGYTAGALMDNFEWLLGYTAKYGLYSVDFTHPNRTRTPRESARYYARVTRTRSIDCANNEQNLID